VALIALDALAAAAVSLPPLNLVRENGVSYPPSRRESIVAGDSVIAAPQPGSAFNDRAIGQLSSIIITLIRISCHTERRVVSPGVHRDGIYLPKYQSATGGIYVEHVENNREVDAHYESPPSPGPDI